MKRHADEGFSLAELLVALSLLGVVLGMSYFAFAAVYKSRDVSERQSKLASEVAQPLTYFEEIGTQNLTIESPTDYSVNFITDRDNDNVRERHIISANSDGTLTDQVWLIDAAGNNSKKYADFTWSTSNANRAQSVPLIKYYGSTTTSATATQITNMADVPGSARKVVMTVVVKVDELYLTDSREILFRNR